MGQLESLLGELASEGTREASGSFGIDTARAREKMQQFQLANPYDYVCELIQAAHLLGASAIDIRCDADEFDMRFGGATLSAEELDGLYSAAMGSREDARHRALWHIAVAFNALFKLDPASIVISSSDEEGQGARLTVRDERTFEVQAHQELPPSENRIYTMESTRPSHLAEFFSKFLSDLPEIEILRRRVRFASIPITVNGERLSRGLELEDWEGTSHAFERDRARGILGVYPGGQMARLQILQHGVLIQEVTRSDFKAPFSCVVEANDLSRDLSLTAFVRDEKWEHLIAEVLTHELRFGLLEELRAREANRWPDWVEGIAHMLLAERAELGGVNPGGSVELALLNELKHAPVWPCWHQPDGVEFVDEDHVSVIEIRRAIKRGARVRVSRDEPSRRNDEQLVLRAGAASRIVLDFMDIKLL